MPHDHHSVTQRHWAQVPIWLYSVLFPFPLGVLQCAKGCSRRHVAAWESALRVTQILLGIEILGWNGLMEAHRWLIETEGLERPKPKVKPDPFNVSLDAMREFVSGQNYMQFDTFSNLRKAMLRRAEAMGNMKAVEVLGMPAAGVRAILGGPPGTIDTASRAREPDRPLPPLDKLSGYQKEGQFLYYAHNQIDRWPRALISAPAERRELSAALVLDIVTDWMPATEAGACYCRGLESCYKHLQISAHTFDDYIADGPVDPNSRSTIRHLRDVFAAGDPRHKWAWNQQVREVERMGPLATTRDYLDYVSAGASATYRAVIDNARPRL